MTEVPFLQFAFLDFEASGLDEDSWPIEVGLSWIDQNLQVQTFESLIRPAPEWPEHAWSPVSAKIHNIPRRDLNDAPDVHTVANDLLVALNGRTALSDAPPFERHWLDRLCSAADVTEHVSLMDFHVITGRNFSSGALDFLYERLERINAPHRAGPDSARFARGWLAGIRREGELKKNVK